MQLLDNIKLINRLAFLLASIAMAIFAISFLYYATQNWFQIDKVVIQGEVSHIKESQVAPILRGKLYGTFFTLNIDIVQNEFQKIPWIKTVKVTREFPDSITVNVEEYKAIARLNSNKLLSEDNHVFEGVYNADTLPIFSVSSSQIGNAILTYKVLKPFLVAHNVKLKSILYSGVWLTKFELTNGLLVVICGSSIVNSLNLLDKYLPNLYQILPNLSYINMCYKDAISIK